MPIQFKARLWTPMEGKGWTFVTMPKEASEKLPKRGRTAVEGTINGFPFKTSAFPDGEGSHQFMVNGTMRAGAKTAVGDTATFIIQPVSDAVEFEIPDYLAAALKKAAKASAQWEKITPKAKAEWAAWITSAKKAETQTARVTKTIERLTKGDKRPSD
ncbi:MAG TPA: YdeI/OmpD-associated family protein [Alloacidobacterium sp.]|jgi:hypothetical protein|nr:YdeI/OmpD-associated family protein [Alloacidobacterium sp.]